MTDNNNPFEDPDVQVQVNSTLPPPTDNAYGDTSWQNEDNNQQSNNNPPPVPPTYTDNVYEQGQNTAIDMTTNEIQNKTNEVQNDYNQSQQNSQNQHAAPDPPNWCEKCMNWFPLQWFAFFAGVLVTTFAALDIIFNSSDTSFIGYVVYFYLFVFGVIVMFIEAPSFKLTRGGQVKIYFWFRFLSRLWGRGWFYLFLALLCMGELDGKTVNFSAFAGFYLMVVMLISFIVSRAAAKKYQRCYVFIAAGTEGEERDNKFATKFKELDMDQDGYLVSSDIVKMAAQAGRGLANSERHAIQTFLDETCNGKVSKEDFLKMFKEYNMKQRFL